MHIPITENFQINRSTFFDSVPQLEPEFSFTRSNENQKAICQLRLSAKIDQIGQRLPANKEFNLFQRSFKATEQDLKLTIKVDGGNYSITEILTHIEKRLNNSDELKPNIDTWINALPKIIY